MRNPLVIAILAKNKEHILPTYLNSILLQTEISSDTIFYIRTNDNRDNTDQLLRDWYLKWNWKFKMVFDDSSVDKSLLKMENHEWNGERCKILADIRQKSIDFAISENADYFVADADNIILPDTISSIRSVGLPVVAPFLECASEKSIYSNFHVEIDQNGYFQNDSMGLYNHIFYQKIKGLIELKVVHCTYFIKNSVLPQISYDDNTYRYEYVMFSDNLRKLEIPQYLDCRKNYGRISFSVNEESFREEMESNPTFQDFVENINKMAPSDWKIR